VHLGLGVEVEGHVNLGVRGGGGETSPFRRTGGGGGTDKSILA
jgi:hypothetical protein